MAAARRSARAAKRSVRRANRSAGVARSLSSMKFCRYAALLSARHGVAAAPAAALLNALEHSRYATDAAPANWLARRRWQAAFRRAGHLLYTQPDRT